MKVTFGAFRGHFEVTLSIPTSNLMCDACTMHTCTDLVGPKTGNDTRVTSGLLGSHFGTISGI